MVVLADQHDAIGKEDKEIGVFTNDGASIEISVLRDKTRNLKLKSWINGLDSCNFTGSGSVRKSLCFTISFE